MPVVVDASVAIKWVVQEQDSDVARRLAASEVMVAPDLMFIECANVLWFKARRGDISPADARSAVAAIDAMPVRSVPIRRHAAAAHAIALEVGRTAYDALYLAVALAERATLVTADGRFAAAAAGHPVYGGALALLSTY